MKYQCDRCHEIETIWNSREHVTPFIVMCPKDGCRGESAHIDWQGDVYAPNHHPKPGDRIFVDLTMEKALKYRRAEADKFWDDPELPMNRLEGTKEEVAERLARSDVDQFGGHAPTIEIAP